MAKKAAEPDNAAIEKLHSETFAAEIALKQLRADLTKTRGIETGRGGKDGLGKVTPQRVVNARPN